MKKVVHTTMILMLTFCGITGFSQEVISSAGEHKAVGNIQVSWTLGEPVIETIPGGDNILTQGFHQTKLVVTPVLTIAENRQINVYPNPVNQVLNISLKGMPVLNVTAEIYSTDGKLLKKNNLTGENSILKVQELANGSYLLKISKGPNLLQTFKIIKQY